MEKINYQMNGEDDQDAEIVEVSQEKTSVMDEIGAAAAMENEDKPWNCHLCEDSREDIDGKPCKNCSSHYDIYGND